MQMEIGIVWVCINHERCAMVMSRNVSTSKRKWVGTDAEWISGRGLIVEYRKGTKIVLLTVEAKKVEKS